MLLQKVEQKEVCSGEVAGKKVRRLTGQARTYLVSRGDRQKHWKRWMSSLAQVTFDITSSLSSKLRRKQWINSREE